MTENIMAVVNISVGNDAPSNIFLHLANFRIKTIYETSGQYDVMCIVDAPDISKLNYIIDNIKNIPGVTNTHTVIILKEIKK